MQAKTIIAPKFTKHFLEHDNMKYFRENAHVVELGSYGEKKDPVGARAYLDVRSKIKFDALAGNVKFVTSVDINWQEVTSGDAGISGFLPVFGLKASAAAQTSLEKVKTGKVKLMLFQIPELALTKMLNSDAGGARKFLADEGDDARVCSAIWVYAEAELAEHFRASTLITASLTGDAAGLFITAKGGKHGTETISPAAGSTCAYRLHKVKKWTDRDKTKVEELETDFKGVG